jgi:G:T/U-mismatch repair DNA glycosylase
MLMTEIIANDEDEKHPYNTQEEIPERTQILIVGTAPPPRFSQNEKRWEGDVDFYYGSSSNQLWAQIFPKVYCEEVLRISRDQSLIACKEFLRVKRIWMVDVLQTYRRKKKDSAEDRHLVPLTFTKFEPIFSRLFELRTVIFTGAKAELWSGAAFEKENLISPGDFKKLDGGHRMPRCRTLTLKVGGGVRAVSAFTLPSPSRASDRRYKHSKASWYEEVLIRNQCPIT